MEILEVKHISKSFGKVKVIDDVSFSVPKGIIIGLVGKNGAGKTSILKAITGLYRVDSGSIKINDYEIDKYPFEALKDVGATIETNEFYDFLNGYDNLYIYSDNSKRIHSVVEFIGLKDNIFKKVSTYSLGMKSRLSLGIAIINNPSLIILDEPTNGLDPGGIIDLRKKLLLLKKEGKSIIISSHLLDEVGKICDVIYFINEGHIVDKVETKNNKDNLEEIYKKVIKEYDEEKYLC